jgi:putative ABC transport system permease protein
MLIHYFKIIWNRKRQNLLLALEMMLAFLVLSVLFTMAANLLLYFSKDLGFDYKNRWVISIAADGSDEFKWTKANRQSIEQIRRHIQQMDGVQTVALIDMTPFSYNNWVNGDSLPTGYANVELSTADDYYAQAMNINIVEGRWFNADDDAANFVPIVINRRYAEAAYPGESPLGKTLMPRFWDKLPPEKQEQLAGYQPLNHRVVGVVDDYRKYGEAEPLKMMALVRSNPSDSNQYVPANLVVHVEESSMNAAFEEKMMQDLERLAPMWTFQISTSEKERQYRMRETFSPLISFALVALFMVIMVALGLVGVIGQNVNARISEIGLRRAVGATQSHIFRQITGELLMLTGLSLFAGTIIAVQFPLLKLFNDIELQAYIVGWAAAVIFVVFTALLCGLYPSQNATRVQPTTALHEE